MYCLYRKLLLNLIIMVGETYFSTLDTSGGVNKYTTLSGPVLNLDTFCCKFSNCLCI